MVEITENTIRKAITGLDGPYTEENHKAALELWAKQRNITIHEFLTKKGPKHDENGNYLGEFLSMCLIGEKVPCET